MDGMRIQVFVFLIFVFQLLHAEEFEVFLQDGRYGIRDRAGLVIVPAVYEKLGWSNSDSMVIGNVIGFKEDNLWGIISVKNKTLTESKYLSLIPFGNDHLKAAVKDKNSNQIYYGILELDGDIAVSFYYADLERFENQISGTILDEHNNTKVGVLDFDDEILIPLKYKHISRVGQWTIADGFSLTKTIYDRIGGSIAKEIDSVRLIKRGLICYSSGLAGLISDKDKVKYDFVYKDFQENKGSVTPVNFPTWEVFHHAKQEASWSCDSLERYNGLWVTYLNGVQHLTLEEKNESLKAYKLIGVSGDHIIVQHTKTHEWGVIKKDGRILFEGFDYIRPSGKFYFARKKKDWYLFNAYGSKINTLPFEEITEGVSNHFITKRDGYWGLIDFQGKLFVHHKYDAIYLVPEGFYTVQFLGKWGIMNKYGGWMINPDFDKLEIYGRLIMGTKGALYSFFYDGSLCSKSIYQISRIVGEVPVLAESGKYGLINPINSTLYRPEYDTIVVSNDLVQFHKDGEIMLISLDGGIEVDYDEGYEAFGEYSYGFVSVKKDGRWGFIDRKSRLRIANRYDEVQPFSEGFAAIKLKGKWGFVDTREQLIVQPFYDYVESFKNGRALFKNQGGLGLVNPFGEEVMAGLAEITRLPTGNFLVKHSDGQFGLADTSGNYILRPTYDQINDIGYGIIVEKDGNVGLLDYKGNQRVKINYSVIKNSGDYLIAH